MPHTRRPCDKAFRRVSLFASSTPKFEPFTSADQVISFNENEQVLEVELDDGTTELFSGNRRQATVFYSIQDADQIRIMCSEEPGRIPVITARIWVRRTDGNGIAYKLPNTVKCSGPCGYVTIPGGNRGVELFGDKYFNQAFRLAQSG